MKDELKKIKNKTYELEQNIEQLNLQIKSNNTISVIQKDFLNFSILESKEFTLCTVTANYQTNIILNLKLNIYLPYSQNITYSLIINNNQILKEEKEFSAGQNIVEIVQPYFSIISQELTIKIKISPKFNKQILLQSAYLTIYGASKNEEDTEYRFCETNTQYLISLTKDNNLYYYICPKSNISLTLSDFKFYTTCISHCFSSDSENIYLFRVDKNNNLFYSNFLNSEEIFISSDVNYVSAIYGKNRILVAFICKNQCCFCEIYNNVLSNIKNIQSIINCKKTFCSYDSSNDKFYILITTTNQDNYLIESISETSLGYETLTYNNSFSITTSGDAL